MHPEASFDPGEFRKRVRSWLAESVPTVWRDAREQLDAAAEIGLRRAWGHALWEAGYAALTWPVEYGGRGFPPISAAIFYEEAARAHAPEELGFVGRNLAGPAILLRGSAEQKEKYVPAIARGDDIWCEGFSEPDAGSDLAAVQTFAERVGDEYRINGSKIWTSYAHVADFCFLLAKTDREAPRHHNLTIFLLDMKQPGVTVRPIQQITGESMFNQVFFTDAVVHSTGILGELNGGWRLSSISQSSFRGGSSIANVWHFYVQMREWQDQLNICCAETARGGEAADSIADRLELLRWHVRRNSGVLDRAEHWFPTVAMSSGTKVFWSELFQEIAVTGLKLDCQTHKGFWRNAYLESRPSTLYGGSVQIQRNVIADQVLKLRKA